MKSFIRVIEIWTPDHQRKQLALADSYYGDLTDFNQESQNISFAYDEGLPGTAWAKAQPIIITDLDHSCFQRVEAAKSVGIRCAIGLPIFAGQYLLAVIVLLCGDIEELAGAVEIWGKDREDPDELSLEGGYYGSLKRFETMSKTASFKKGAGLPGTVWDYRVPQIVADMYSSDIFLRASNAQVDGITTAFGIPFIYNEQKEYVLTLLSARSTPIARRFEIWLPDRDHESASLYTGHSELTKDAFTHKAIRKGEGFIGQVWQTGCPAISRQPAKDMMITGDAAVEGLRTSIAIPVIEDGALKAIVAFTL